MCVRVNVCMCVCMYVRMCACVLCMLCVLCAVCGVCVCCVVCVCVCRPEHQKKIALLPAHRSIERRASRVGPPNRRLPANGTTVFFPSFLRPFVPSIAKEAHPCIGKVLEVRWATVLAHRPYKSFSVTKAFQLQPQVSDTPSAQKFSDQTM